MQEDAGEAMIAVDLGPRNQRIRFSSLQQVREWVQTEEDRWRAVLSAALQPGRRNELHTKFMAALQNLRNSIPAHTLDEVLTEQLADSIGKTFHSVYASTQLLRSDVPSGKFVLALASEDTVAALAAYRHFVKVIETPSDSRGILGVVRAILFDEGQVGSASTREAALVEMSDRWEKELAAAASRALGTAQQLGASLLEGRNGIESFRESAGNSIAEMQEDFAGLKASFHEHLVLAAPAQYWADQARKRRIHATWWGLASGAVFLGLAGALSFLAHWLLQAEGGFNYHHLALIGLATALGLWSLRIPTRILMSCLHLAADASERKIMVHTFLSLVREGHASREHDRHLVLQALFRGAPTGLVQEDGQGPAMIDITQKVLGDKPR